MIAMRVGDEDRRSFSPANVLSSALIWQEIAGRVDDRDLALADDIGECVK